MALNESTTIAYGADAPVNRLIPISVMRITDAIFNDTTFEMIVEDWTSRDDVWSEAFLTGQFSIWDLYTISDTTFATDDGDTYGNNMLPSGPYFLDPLSGNIFQAYRLYEDEYQAFVYGTVPSDDGSYEILSAKIHGAATETIGVPSRLYFTPTVKKPLAGLRLAVKDIYDVKGLRTGCGSRAYWSLYPPKERTAPAVQRLLDAGLVLVGKAKTSQFANREVATGDWVDYHAPYNPRGDGYQDGSSSSTGSGAAVAAYPWLDFAIGSDTGGSMRGPAGVDGVFGNRPSLGAVSLDGVVPVSPEFDTAGIFARDAKLWSAVGRWWYQDLVSFPTKLLFPVDVWETSYIENPPVKNTTAETFNSFIQKLESFLNVERTEMNLTKLWSETKPASAPATLNDLLNGTYPPVIARDQATLLAEPFFADYAAVNSGRKPFVDPTPLSRWEYGWSLSADMHDEAIANKTLFEDWFTGTVLPADSPRSCSESIMIYPQSSGETVYRNQYLRPPVLPYGFSSGRIAVFAGVPDMVVPVGEAPYTSKITGKTEYLPVTVSFVIAKGCDMVLFRLFAAMQEAGVIKAVSTGPRLYAE
ncbi:amidase signature enzyme [Wolfiporia cocos MD-104 SS10]|uniref:Amidase signature enzyme n=1 Tax=Wolfiporia cocos (strain MD-104) TaxID=742152 RepID=A0A2H3JFV9_WOLCO|nr:amidase signature enzyme [Wolfiporia cocos MD-104 SS10]